jgi:hypothetical protein
VRSADHNTPRHTLFTILLVLLPRPFQAQIYSSAYYSRTPAAYFTPSPLQANFQYSLEHFILFILDRELEYQRFCTEKEHTFPDLNQTLKFFWAVYGIQVREAY